MALNIVGLEELKTWLGVTGTASDSILTAIGETVEGLINDYCDTRFDGVQTVTGEILDGRRADILLPEHLPIVAVTRIALWCETDGSGGTNLDAADYIVRPEEIALKGQYTPKGRGLIAIDYTWGYADIPARVKMAARIACEAYYRQRARQSVGITSRSKEGESVSYKDAWSKEWGLPQEAIGLLAPYRTAMEWPSSYSTGNN